MAFKIIWTKQAIKGYDKIIDYLEKNWAEKEIFNFINETDQFFEVLILHPEILQKTNKHKNLYRGPINNLTMLTYRIKPRVKQIELINIRGARQKPLKRYPPL
jgi:plasmid stabilization system protein ParE